MDTTIAAISTAYGEAGIGIVRMSGPDSLKVLRKVFVPRVCTAEGAAAFEYEPRHMYFGSAVDAAGSFIDDCLAVYMPGPNSYTGEDVAELQCHGSMVSYKKILAAFLAALSQLLLKLSAGEHRSGIRVYLNVKVIAGYGLLMLTMLMNVWAYQTVEYHLGPVLNASSYIFVMILSTLVLKEKLTLMKSLGFLLIISGICISALL